jgi:hypothetical protein
MLEGPCACLFSRPACTLRGAEHKGVSVGTWRSGTCCSYTSLLPNAPPCSGESGDRKAMAAFRQEQQAAKQRLERDRAKWHVSRARRALPLRGAGALRHSRHVMPPRAARGGQLTPLPSNPPRRLQADAKARQKARAAARKAAEDEERRRAKEKASAEGAIAA